LRTIGFIFGKFENITKSPTTFPNSFKDAIEVAPITPGKHGAFFSRPELHTHGSTQKRGEEFRRVVKEVEEMFKARKLLQQRV
jgi:hypothetical protein